MGVVDEGKVESEEQQQNFGLSGATLSQSFRSGPSFAISATDVESGGSGTYYQNPSPTTSQQHQQQHSRSNSERHSTNSPTTKQRQNHQRMGSTITINTNNSSDHRSQSEHHQRNDRRSQLNQHHHNNNNQNQLQHHHQDPLNQRGVDNPAFSILRKNIESAEAASRVDPKAFKPRLSGKAQKLFRERDSISEMFKWKANMMEKHDQLQEKSEKEEEKKFLDSCRFEPEIDLHSEYIVQSMGDRRMTVQDQALMTARQKAEEAIEVLARRELEKQRDLKYFEQQKKKMEAYERGENHRREMMMQEQQEGQAEVEQQQQQQQLRRPSSSSSMKMKSHHQENDAKRTSANPSQMKIHDLRRQWMQAVFSL